MEVEATKKGRGRDRERQILFLEIKEREGLDFK